MLMKVFDDVCEEYGKVMNLKIISDSIIPPAFNWKCVLLPERYLAENVEVLTGIFRHEIGHWFFCPKSPEIGATMDYICSYVGCIEPHLASNVIADIIVDCTLIDIHGEEYYNFMKISAKKSPQTLLIKTMIDVISIYAEKRGLESFGEHTSEAASLYRILFENKNHFYIKVHQAAQILKRLINEKCGRMLMYHSHLKRFGCGISEVQIAKEFRDSGVDPMKIFSEEHRVGTSGELMLMDNPVLVEYEKMRLLTKYLEMKNKYGSKCSKQKTYKTWNMGDLPEDLDVHKSVSMFGLVIPSIYSLKAAESDRDARERGDDLRYHLALILDCSGSMEYMNNIKKVREAAFVAVKRAAEKKCKVSVIPFTSDVAKEHIIKRSYNYDACLDLIARLCASGGTVLRNALKEVLEMPREKTKSIVMTDAEVADVEQCREKVKKLGEMGDVSIFLMSNEINESNRWVFDAGCEVVMIHPKHLTLKVYKGRW